MNAAAAKRAVMLFLFVGGGLNAIRVVRDGKGEEVPRVIIGIAIASLTLSLLAEALPQIAGPMAVTALTVSVLYSGTPELIMAALGQKGA